MITTCMCVLGVRIFMLFYVVYVIITLQFLLLENIEFKITSNSNQIGSAVSQIVLSCTYAIEYNVMSLQVPNFTITKYTNQNNSYLN